MRIKITPRGVIIHHGLSDEGKLTLGFDTNNVIVIEITEDVPPGNLEIRDARS